MAAAAVAAAWYALLGWLVWCWRRWVQTGGRADVAVGEGKNLPWPPRRGKSMQLGNRTQSWAVAASRRRGRVITGSYLGILVEQWLQTLEQ